MSSLFNVQNAPRDLNTLSQMSTSVLYRLAMQLCLFKDDEEKERAFTASSSAEKAPIILQRLHEIDNNPQAAAALAMPMTLPTTAPQQEPMSQPNFPGAPPGAQPYQPQLPYGPPPAPPGPPGGYAPPQGAPPGPPPGWGPPGATPQQYGAPPQQQGHYQPPQPPPGPPGYGPPQGAPPGAPPGAWPQQAPGGYAPPPQAPSAPPGPPQGSWSPPGPPGAPPGAGGWTPPGPSQGGPPLAYGPPGAPVQPARSPSTPSDPGNQGAAAQQLLDAIQGLTTQLSRQNDLLAGLSTLAENNFIASVIIAGQMNVPRDQLAQIVAGERDTIKRQFLPQGKA